MIDGEIQNLEVQRKCVPLNDLAVGLLKKPGMVESIMINGQSVSYVRRKFSPNAAVVISYHSYR